MQKNNFGHTMLGAALGELLVLQLAALALLLLLQLVPLLCSIGMLSKSKTFTMITAVLLPLVPLCSWIRVSISFWNQIKYAKAKLVLVLLLVQLLLLRHYLCSIGMLSKSKTFTTITAVLIPLVPLCSWSRVRVSILPRNQIEYVYCL